MALELSRVRPLSPSGIVRALGEVRRYPIIPVIILLSVLVIPSILPALVAPYEPLQGDMRNRLSPPSAEHLEPILIIQRL